LSFDEVIKERKRKTTFLLKLSVQPLFVSGKYW